MRKKWEIKMEKMHIGNVMKSRIIYLLFTNIEIRNKSTIGGES